MTHDPSDRANITNDPQAETTGKEPVEPAADEYPTPRAVFMVAVKDAGEALKFYERAFGATRELVVTHPSGRVVHAEFTINGVLMMASNEIESLGFKYPTALGGFSACGMIQVDDLKAAMQRAEGAGAKVMLRETEAYDFLRRSRVEDPYGHVWQMVEHTRPFTRGELLDAATSQAASVGYDVTT